MKKVLFFVLVLTTAFVVFIGCSAKEDVGQSDTVSLSLMHFATKEGASTDGRAAAIQEQLARFAEMYPEIVIENTEMSHDDYQVKIQQLAATDSMPDVFMLKGPWINTFEENELISDIAADIDAYEFSDLYFDNIFRIATRGSKIYGLPYEANTSTTYVFYNKEMWREAGFDEFPKTWDEMFIANEYFKSQGIPMIGLGNKDKWPAGSSILSTLGDRFTGSAWTQSIIQNDGDAKFTDSEFVAALQLLADLAAADAFNADFNSVNNNQTQALFRQGKYASIIEGSWAMSGILGEATDEMKDNIGVAALPMPSNAKGEANSSAGGAGWFFAINADLEGAEREAAITLLFTLLGKEYSEYVAINYSEPTPMKVDVEATGLLQVQEEFLALNASYNIIPVYDVWMTPQVIEAMNTSLQGLLAGTRTPEEVGQAIQDAQDQN